MLSEKQMAEMVDAVRHLMGDDALNHDFRFPTNLETVPSYTSDRTIQFNFGEQVKPYAQLG